MSVTIFINLTHNANGDHCPNGKATEHICWVMLVV